MRLSMVPLVLVAISVAAAEETLEAPGLREQVKVERTQFEVIVRPPHDNVALCSSLTKSDFELRWARRPFAGFDVDPLQIPTEVRRQATWEGAPPEEPAVPLEGRLVALVFDWVGLRGRDDDEYSPRARAFAQSRAYIDAHPLDRFVIIDIGDEATFRSTTFLPGPEALATLDRFKSDTDATGFLIRGPHLTWNFWRDAVLETVSRLGAMAPSDTKDLFVLTTDVLYPDAFPFNDVFHEDLAKLTTENKVRVHSLDLGWDRRVLPYGLFAFSEAGGGAVFTDGDTLTTSIHTLDRLRPCTYLITLNVPDSKRAIPLSVGMRDPRFRVIAPIAVGGRFDVVAAENATLKNDLDNPTIEAGVRITPQLVPVTRGQRSTEYALTLHVEKTADFDPEDIETLRVYGAVWNKLKPQTKMYADFSAFRITEVALRKIAAGEGEIFRFPETVKIPNREESVSVIVSVHGPRESLSTVAASRRIEVELPN